MQKYNQKINLNLSGTAFTDELHNFVGSSVFILDHDWFLNDIASGDILIIRTAAAGGGTLLVEDTDYTISNRDNTLSDIDHCNKDVYSDITIINVAYQACDLYFSGKYIADSTSKDDISQITWQYEIISISQTIAPTSYKTYGCTAGANGIKIILPPATEFIKNLKLEFIKLDLTDSAVMIDGNGAETINELLYIFLIHKYQKIQIMCTGTSWIITKGTLIADTGHIYRTLYATAAGYELGCSNCPYDTLVGTIGIGEKVTEETSNNTAIVVANSGNVLTLWKVTGTGYWTNNKILTFSGGATALVNTPTTTLNINYPFYHGFGVTQEKLDCQMYFGTTAACTIRLPQQNGPIASVPQYGQAFLQVDTNNLKLQMGVSGLAGMGDDGNRILGDTNSYYRLVTKLII